MSDAGFWNDRVRRHGHTGWADPSVYAFDQRMRLAAVRAVLGVLNLPQAACALDFGCGTGDFCAVLAEHCSVVVGYDYSPSVLEVARQSHAQPKIRFVDHMDAAFARRCDLVLCVTVLQHLIDDAQLHAVLRRIVDCLNPGGHVLLIESFTEAGQGAEAGYLKRRELAEFVAMLAESGLTLLSQHGMHHPTLSPSPAYLSYSGQWVVRVLRRLTLWRMPGAAWMLSQLASRFMPAAIDQSMHHDSPTQLLLLQRRECP